MSYPFILLHLAAAKHAVVDRDVLNRLAPLASNFDMLLFVIHFVSVVAGDQGWRYVLLSCRDRA